MSNAAESSSSPDIRVILSTCPPAEAERLAELLVEKRLVACVNIVVGLKSVYRWEGALQRDSESLLLIKAPAARLEETIRVLAEAHPYDVPEIIALDVLGGYAPYLDWVVGEAR